MDNEEEEVETMTEMTQTMEVKEMMMMVIHEGRDKVVTSDGDHLGRQDDDHSRRHARKTRQSDSDNDSTRGSGSSNDGVLRHLDSTIDQISLIARLSPLQP